MVVTAHSRRNYRLQPVEEPVTSFSIPITFDLSVPYIPEAATVSTESQLPTLAAGSLYIPPTHTPSPEAPVRDKGNGTTIIYAHNCRCCQSILPVNESLTYGTVCENCWVGEQCVKGRVRSYKEQSSAEHYRLLCNSLFE